MLPIKLPLFAYLTTSLNESSLIPAEADVPEWQVLHFAFNNGSITAEKEGFASGAHNVSG